MPVTFFKITGISYKCKILEYTNLTTVRIKSQARFPDVIKLPERRILEPPSATIYFNSISCKIRGFIVLYIKV